MMVELVVRPSLVYAAPINDKLDDGCADALSLRPKSNREIPEFIGTRMPPLKSAL